MDIDTILKHAAERVQTQETTVGEDLLSSFTVANFSIGDAASTSTTSTSNSGTNLDNFWERIIPENLRNQEQHVAVLPPRRRMKLEDIKPEKGFPF